MRIRIRNPLAPKFKGNQGADPHHFNADADPGVQIKPVHCVYIQHIPDVIVQNRPPVFRMDTVDRLFLLSTRVHL